jgi:hypothetical protein
VVAESTGAQLAAGRGPSGTFSGVKAGRGEGGSAWPSGEDSEGAAMTITTTDAAIRRPAAAMAAPNPLQRIGLMPFSP